MRLSTPLEFCKAVCFSNNSTSAGSVSKKRQPTCFKPMSAPGRCPNRSNASIDRKASAMLISSENWSRTPPADFDVDPHDNSSASSSTTSVTPASARWNAALVPITPPPTITTSARSGSDRSNAIQSLSVTDQPTPIQPVAATTMPRYAGSSTFVRLPELRDVARCDIAIRGAPFDGGVSFRPGARFGPMAVRQASRALRPQYHPQFDVQPFANLQFADAGDVACNPYSIAESLASIEARAIELLGPADGPHPVDGLITIGGDPPIAYALLKTMHQRFGKVALVHFDAHLDTWDVYFGERFTHGTPFRRAAEEGLFDTEASMNVGIRGPIYSPTAYTEDAALGFSMISCDDIERLGVDEVARRIRERVGDRPLYLSIDIDVLDPAHAPGTGTPEIAGMTTRELVMILRGLAGMNLVSADVVEVAPAYDHAEITSLAAATTVYELACLMAVKQR